MVTLTQSMGMQWENVKFYKRHISRQIIRSSPRETRAFVLGGMKNIDTGKKLYSFFKCIILLYTVNGNPSMKDTREQNVWAEISLRGLNTRR